MLNNDLTETVMKSGYFKKYDWIILKPIWLFFIGATIFYFVNGEWFMGGVTILLDFLIGIIASSLHSSAASSELFSGYPHSSTLSQREDDALGIEESRIIGKTTLKVGIVLGICILIVTIHNEITWYYAILFSVFGSWLSMIIISLFFGLIVKFMQVKK